MFMHIHNVTFSAWKAGTVIDSLDTQAQHMHKHAYMIPKNYEIQKREIERGTVEQITDVLS